jgi:hypothetical protein
MGQIRDELYDTMWDPVTCGKHNWKGADRRFSCPHCEKESDDVFNVRRQQAIEILKPYGLTDLVKYSRVY